MRAFLYLNKHHAVCIEAQDFIHILYFDFETNIDVLFSIAQIQPRNRTTIELICTTKNNREVLQLQHLPIIQDITLLVNLTQKVVHRLYRVEGNKRNLNEESIPVTHGTVPQTGKLHSLQLTAIL